MKRPSGKWRSSFVKNCANKSSKPNKHPALRGVFLYYGMCYDTLSLTKRSLDYAKRIGYASGTVAELQERFDKMKEAQEPLFHVSGFQHPTLPIIRNWQQPEPEAFLWGLIPFWVKSKEQGQEIWNRTLNARGESIFKKPSFRAAAKSRRCLVVTDGFYEHHHHDGKTIPFLIQAREEAPLLLGGLYAFWEDRESGKTWRSFSIVTVPGNRLMSKIHNKPKMSGPRMPLIIAQGQEEQWLNTEGEQSKAAAQALLQPYPDDGLKAHPVKRLRGKAASGNRPETLEVENYPGLDRFWENDS